VKFTHLHLHTEYSLLDGLPKIDELLDLVEKYKMDACAITDHGVMYGVIEFYKKALQRGIKPIIGQELYIAAHGMSNKRTKIDKERYHLVVLAQNELGYKNLIKLTTLAHLKGFYYKPRVDLELLKKYSSGLIALSGCLSGQIPKAILSGNKEKTEETIELYQNIFGRDNFYLELQHHPNIPEQEKVNNFLIDYARKKGLRLVATNDVHYLNPEDAQIQDVLLAIQTKKELQSEDRMTMKRDDFSFRPQKRMEKEFSSVPDALENTAKIARRCNLQIELGNPKLPHFPITEETSDIDFLRNLCLQGLRTRFGIKVKQDNWISPLDKKETEKIKQRFQYELSIIEKTGFASYFLIVHDIVSWAKQRGIVVGPGRGSAAGSLVSYLLNITDVNPLEYGLLFERFLNPERISMPDIDLDFADARRDEVIEYAKRKYGQDNVAQIITFGTLAARVAVRDVGRVLGYEYSFCDRLAKSIPFGATFQEALKKSPDFVELYEKDRRARKIVNIAKRLEGVVRHASTHACGVVITDQSLDELTPRQYASQSDKTVITQYDMYSIENLGLLKMDFLGLKNLTIIENTLKFIKANYGKEIGIEDIPANDRKTFSLLKKGQTTGVFQLESEGMKRYLRKLSPSTMEDIIAMVALYRPGPMELIPQFIEWKNNPDKIEYLHPALKPILQNTYGIAIYQEQLIQIAQKLAGFTLGQADILRKAVGKKIKTLLASQKRKLIAGMRKNRIPLKTALKIWEWIKPFARYGFNRSHAACYATIAYQTAYLKAHYPTEFMAALLNSKGADIERISFLIEEIKDMGIQVLPPDINESFSDFTPLKEKKIRFGLGAIKNVGSNVVRAIIEEREKAGAYKDISDFIQRIQQKDLNKKSMEALIKSGAMDKLEERNKLLYNLEKILKASQEVRKQALNNQADLFHGIESPAFRIKLDEAPPAEEKKCLKWEKELLGFYISSHPLKKYERILKSKATALKRISSSLRGRNIVVGGVIEEIRRINTRNGDIMLFVTLEDLSSRREIVVFSNILQKQAALWQKGKIIFAQVSVRSRRGNLNLVCLKAKELQ